MRYLITLVTLLWTAMLAIAMCPSKCTCKNKVVTCQYEFLEEIPDNIPSDTSELYFDGNYIKHIRTSKLTHLTELKQLSFGSNSVEIIDDGAFSNMVQLMKLSLNDNKLSHIKKTHFQNLTSLLELRLFKQLHQSALTIEDYSFKDLQKLQVLSLKQTKIARISNNTFFGLKRLQVLDLSLNPIQLYSSASFSHFTSNEPDIKLPEQKPVCCCQSKQAISNALASFSSYTCVYENGNTTEGDIRSMPCINDGDVCGSIKESTSKIWPPPAIEKPKFTSVISSLISSSSYSSDKPISSNLQHTSSKKILLSPSINQSSPMLDILPTKKFKSSAGDFIMAQTSVKLTAETTRISQFNSVNYLSSMSPSKSSVVIKTTSVDSSSPISIIFEKVKSVTLVKADSPIIQTTTIATSPNIQESTTMELQSTMANSVQPSSSLNIHFDLTTASKPEIFTIAASTATLSCSIISCTSGCTFSVLLCKCVQEKTNNSSCIVSRSQGKQTSTETGMSTGIIALIVGSIAFVIAILLLFIFLKKRQRRDRRFNMQRNGNVEMRNSDENVSGRDNNGFIIEGDENENNRPSDALY